MTPPKRTTPKSDELTPGQVRAARALLAWSQQRLAKEASVAQSTIADFERGVRTPVPNNAEAIRAALRDAGVNFLQGGAVMGPPIPALKGASGKGGIDLINATDLEQWAARRDAQGAIPTLLAKLATATGGPNAKIDFPAEESIQQGGWDGVTYADETSRYVPEGVAGWEISTQRSSIVRKALDDYEKRTIEPLHLDRATSTFVFVTPRNWPAKAAWEKERKLENKWRDVRAYDATDLVRWIAQHPSIGLWLAAAIGKRPQGAYQLDELWTEWSRATRWALSEELVLADRDEEAAQVLAWLRGEPSVLALKGETADEAAAFVYAAIKSLPAENAGHYLSRAVMTTNADTARTLSDGGEPLIIVLLDPDPAPGLAQRIALAGHYVVLAYGDGEHGVGDLTTLPRPSRAGISAALTRMGIAQDRAEVLARDAARSLAALRRLIPGAPGRLPRWATEAPPSRALLAAMMAGGWNEQNDADKRALERLSGMSYSEFSSALPRYISSLDSPLRKVGEAWKVASPRDLWFLMANHLSGDDVERFQAVIIDVLGSTDPRFDLDPNERWKASLDNIAPEYSGWLRNGLGEVLILLSIFGDRVLAARDGARRARHVVRTLLKDAGAQQWWSLSEDFRLLAEAAPEVFMEMVEESLAKEDKPVAALFEHGDDALFSGENISNLLWALSALAWSPLYVSRVADILARLDAIDPGGRFSNRPAGSLRDIFLLWSPQTYATYDERLKVLDLLRRKHPDAAWKLLLQILPKGRDIVTPAPQPRWLDFSEWKREETTYAILQQGAVAITSRVLDDAGNRAERWAELIDRLPDFAPDCLEAIRRLSTVTERTTDAADIDRFRTELRAFLHHHRAYPDAGWALAADKLDQLEAIYERLTPQDLVTKYAWLFRDDAQLPKSRTPGWQDQEQELLELRQEAALQLLNIGGVPALFAAAREIDTAGYIGAALCQSSVPETTQQEVIKTALLSDNGRERNIAYGLISVSARQRGQKWAETLFARAQSEAWGMTAIVTLLRALPKERWSWGLAAAAGEESEREYWETLPVLWISGQIDDIEFAARKLMSVNRSHHAVHLLGPHLKANPSSEILVEVLKRAVVDANEKKEAGNQATMFRHYVTEIFNILDGRGNVDEDTMFGLEWTYMRLLANSDRQPRALLKALAERPEFFIQMIKIIFKPSEESGIVDEPLDNLTYSKDVALHAYELLSVWDRVPGSDDGGNIDYEKLLGWVRRARILAAEAGREDIADQRIGNVLSSAKQNPGELWPPREVRDLIENIRSEELERGLAIGLYNRRGVTTRGVLEGGQQERDEAARYHSYADATSLEWPRTSALLRRIAQDYEAEAEKHDERAQRNEW